MENIPEKITRDQLLFKEFITALLVVLLILWAALLFPAPLSNPGREGVYAGSSGSGPLDFFGGSNPAFISAASLGRPDSPLRGPFPSGPVPLGIEIRIRPPEHLFCFRDFDPVSGGPDRLGPMVWAGGTINNKTKSEFKNFFRQDLPDYLDFCAFSEERHKPNRSTDER